MRILVPFDFTKSSENALNFAFLHCGVSDQIDIFHTIGPIYMVPEIPVYIERKDEVTNAKEHLREVVNKLSKSYPIASNQLNVIVTEGPIVSSIFTQLESIKYDYVIMATHDKESLFDRILGSNSNSVATLSDIPVIMVHATPEANRKVSKVLFAFDCKPTVANALKQFLKINKVWNIPADFLHINTDNDDVNEQFDLILKNCYIEQEVTFPINVNVIKSNNAIVEIENQIEKNGYDLVVLVKDNSGLFSGYFAPSFSIKTAHKINVPIMILKEKP